MAELHNGAELNLQTIGFTYPEDSDTDSLEQLKQHEIRLAQTKDALLGQQTRLKRALQNFKKMKKGKCHNYFEQNRDIRIRFTMLRAFQAQCAVTVGRMRIKRCAKQVRSLILTTVSRSMELLKLV